MGKKKNTTGKKSKIAKHAKVSAKINKSKR